MSVVRSLIVFGALFTQPVISIAAEPKPTALNRPLGQMSAPQAQMRRFPSQMSALGLDPAATPSTAPIKSVKPPINEEQAYVSRLADRLNKFMKNRSVGYSVTVMGRSGVAASATGGCARCAPVDTAPRGWTADERITIASVSKTLTAAAVMKALTDRKISPNFTAWLFLPQDWKFHESFKKISVAQLLSHTSGIISCSTEAGPVADCTKLGLKDCGITLEALKACAEQGIEPTRRGKPQYSNANYAFLRPILLQLADKAVPPTAAAQGSRYVQVVNKLVLIPSGAGSAQCQPSSATPPLSYKSTTDNGKEGIFIENYNWDSLQPGEPWGNMTEVCGSQGWTLSSNQLAQVMHALMFTDKIVPQSVVDEMRANNYGLWWWNAAAGLTACQHGGYHPAGWNGGELNTLVAGFDNGITVGAIINSRYRGDFGAELALAVKTN